MSGLANLTLTEAAERRGLSVEQRVRLVADVCDAVQASLVATVASTWLGVQADDVLLALTQQTLTSREDSLRLTRLRFERGAASALDLPSSPSFFPVSPLAFSISASNSFSRFPH